MSRQCDVTGRKPMFGNNVSHAHNKSRRRFDINLQKKRFWLADENRWITLNVSTQGLRLIDKIGIRKVLNRMRADGKKSLKNFLYDRKILLCYSPSSKDEGLFFIMILFSVL
jgi:large subunit ribosomal protein L28